MDLFELSGASAHISGSSIADAAALLNVTKHLLRIIDAPATVMGHGRTIDYHARHFPVFMAAYGTAFAKSSGGRAPLTSVSRAQRHALKLALHEDVKAIVHTASEEARAPKRIDGAALPTEPIECMQSVDALVREAEAQLAALQARIAQLHDVRLSVERMANNIAPKHALPDAAFTSTPQPTAKEEAKRAAKRPKRQ